MKPGAQWIAFDAEFIRKPLGQALMTRFGGDGVVVFLTWLCACKTGPVPGTFTYGGDEDGIRRLGLEALRMVAPDGSRFGLQDVFRLLAGHKQVRTRRSAGLIHVTSTSWTGWQQERDRQNARERKRRQRAQNEGDSDVTRTGQDRDSGGDNVTPDIDIDNDIPPPPSSTVTDGTGHDPPDPRGETPRTPEEDKSNPNGNGHRRRPANEPPADPVEAAVAMLARRRLATAVAEADAGQRQPVRNHAGWLAAAADEIRSTAADDLAEAGRRAGPGAAADAVVAAYDRLAAARSADRVAATQAMTAALDAVPVATDGKARLVDLRAQLGAAR